MITKEMIELIRSTVNKAKISDNEVARIEGLGDLWVSMSNKKEIHQESSIFYKIGSIDLDNRTYYVFGRR